jgi:hypothetical protein
MDPVVVYAPKCVQNGSESFGLKALEDFKAQSNFQCRNKSNVVINNELHIIAM